MTLEAVGFRCHQRTRHRCSRLIAAAMGKKRVRHALCEIGEGQRAHALKTFFTFSTVTHDTRVLDSTVTPAICGVRIKCGTSAKTPPALRGSSMNTSSAAPPSFFDFNATATTV